MTDQLMIGILLIIVGIAVGLIAVALVLNRREDQIAAEADEEQIEGEPGVMAEASDIKEVEGTEEEEKAGLAPEDSDSLAEVDGPPDADGSEQPAEEADRGRNLIAEVYREEVTGRLVVRAGDREYTDGKQIRDETERRRLAYAASDLADWFQGEFEPRAPTAPGAAPQPGSPEHMLEEINVILQRTLAGEPDRGIRLFPGPDGGVRVLIGVKSYEIEEVPDQEIKDLIRQAVAEWEAGQ